MKLNLFKYFFRLQIARNSCTRYYSKKIRKYDEHADDLIKPIGMYAIAKPWKEKKQIQLHVRKRKKVFHMEMSLLDMQAFLYGLRSFPSTPEELRYWLLNRKAQRDVWEQEYIPDRVILLRSDLAAAQFIVNRGGAIRWYGDPRWVGLDREVKTLPEYYVPGLYVEYIDATGTRLQYEGLMNLMNLRRLRWLCLSGCDLLDNFALDLLSSEYADQLIYLDISHCRGIDYNGLSCMYRFEKLKTLDVTGIAGTAEFKMACSMLEELDPKLEIIGVDYSLPLDKYKSETTEKLFK